MASLKSWVSEHKLTTIGTLWALSVAVSFVYTRKKYPIKDSVLLIRSRLPARALTLSVLSGMAIKHYYFDAKDDGCMYPPEWADVPEGCMYPKDAGNAWYMLALVVRRWISCVSLPYSL